jgi:prepilin-type N-terminal cleavage/methylation domain-containing protein/prepilin-type processing-associated H-X9-DG protein
MRWRPGRGFTLVELLVVIAIIGVLMAVLLPALSRARESAYTIKCAANLHSIGQAMAVYVVNNRGTLPASNYYKGLVLNGQEQTPATPDQGFVHWSSFLFSDKSKLADDEAFKSLRGWDIFQCPSIPNGGLRPANTYDGNSDGLDNDIPGVVDWQAPRLAYTVNEALCPRGIFVRQFADRGSVRAYKFVKAAVVKGPDRTILATELVGNQSVMTSSSLTGGSTPPSNSRRPVSGFEGGMYGPDELYKVPSSVLFTKATRNEIKKNADAAGSVLTTLSFVGRNHGRKTVDAKGYDLRKTNFLYLDGHVQTKHIFDTLDPFEWGEQFYTLQ